MPAMPRPKGRASKIAFAILGVPANMQSKPSRVKRKIDRRLVFQETSRVR